MLLPAFAATTPGLEKILVGELVNLGFELGPLEPGGINFGTTNEGLATALLQLRTANRITIPMASFKARTFAELERQAEGIDWSTVMTPGVAIHFRVSSKKSRLYHQDAIAERLERICLGSIQGTSAVRKPGEAEEFERNLSEPTLLQRIIVRVVRDQVTISADSCGAKLHRRGYRLDVAKAPLRETLAAAMLLGAGWQPDEPLLDPLAGSGTIAIEAAMIARRLAPGRNRRFAAESWPGMQPAFESARKKAKENELPRGNANISGSDRDPGALLAAIANANRAGVALDLSMRRGVISEVASDDGKGLVITNPPYGVRVGQLNALRDLYATLGSVMRNRLPAWRIGMLSSDRILEGQVGAKFNEVWRSTNGGLPIRFVISS